MSRGKQRTASGQSLPKKGRGARKASLVVSTLAKTTLFAAGIVATRIGSPEIDPDMRMFNPNLLDRLEAPITRYHE